MMGLATCEDSYRRLYDDFTTYVKRFKRMYVNPSYKISQPRESETMS